MVLSAMVKSRRAVWVTTLVSCSGGLSECSIEYSDYLVLLFITRWSRCFCSPLFCSFVVQTFVSAASSGIYPPNGLYSNGTGFIIGAHVTSVLEITSSVSLLVHDKSVHPSLDSTAS